MFEHLKRKKQHPPSRKNLRHSRTEKRNARLIHSSSISCSCFPLCLSFVLTFFLLFFFPFSCFISSTLLNYYYPIHVMTLTRICNPCCCAVFFRRYDYRNRVLKKEEEESILIYYHVLVNSIIADRQKARTWKVNRNEVLIVFGQIFFSLAI